MGGETEREVSGWTVDTLKTLADERERHWIMFTEERDRRYAEVSLEREKALKIKEVADRDALELARQIQTYKDEKANELREQISSERGNYASKDDVAAAVGKIEATIIPVIQYVATQQGRSGGMQQYWGWIVAGAGILIPLLAVVVTLLTKGV